MKYSIFEVLVKCVGVAKFSKNTHTHVQCGSELSEKLLCAECAGVPKLAALKYSGEKITPKHCFLSIFQFAAFPIFLGRLKLLIFLSAN